jgi:hypothetical protein
MSRPFLPSIVLAALALASTVRPRLMKDWPELTDARIVRRVPVSLELDLGVDPVCVRQDAAGRWACAKTRACWIERAASIGQF